MDRRAQNRGAKEFETLKRLISDLDERIMDVLGRGSYTSGIRVKDRAPLAPELRGDLDYSDPTGDEAISDELRDSVTADVEAMVKHVSYALNIAKHVLAITPTDVSERAQREIPDCAACGDPITGKIFYGRWDNKCRVRFRRWVEAGNAADEKLRFELIVRREKSACTSSEQV